MRFHCDRRRASVNAQPQKKQPELSPPVARVGNWGPGMILGGGTRLAREPPRRAGDGAKKRRGRGYRQRRWFFSARLASVLALANDGRFTPLAAASASGAGQTGQTQQRQCAGRRNGRPLETSLLGWDLRVRVTPLDVPNAAGVLAP